MANKKVIGFIVIAIIFLLVVSVIIVNNIGYDNDDAVPIIIPENETYYDNPLEGFPYVGQETSIFCASASIAAILQYLDIDVTLSELIFNLGIGFSSFYEGGESGFNVINGVFVTQHPENFNFVTSLYGVYFDLWYPQNVRDENQIWNQYWISVKDNISNGYPIITSVDPFSLPSIRNQFSFSEEVWNNIPPSGHSIILLGYDENSQTVCYNDPGTDYFGNPDDGIYVWMTIDELKSAISKSAATRYSIGRFIKVTNPLSKEERFNQALDLNIEKLKGNTSAYFYEFKELSLGIKSVKDIKDHFEGGLLNKLKTKNILKKTGRNYRRIHFNNWFQSLIMSVKYKDIKPLLITDLPFKLIASEKEYVVDYLRSINYDEKAKELADLIEQEIDYWLKIDKNFNKFLDRGFIIGPVRGLLFVNTIGKALDNIIQIEQKIIDL
jgi:hypothetical protein